MDVIASRRRRSSSTATPTGRRTAAHRRASRSACSTSCRRRRPGSGCSACSATSDRPTTSSRRSSSPGSTAGCATCPATSTHGPMSWSRGPTACSLRPTAGRRPAGRRTCCRLLPAGRRRTSKAGSRRHSAACRVPPPCSSSGRSLRACRSSVNRCSTSGCGWPSRMPMWPPASRHSTQAAIQYPRATRTGCDRRAISRRLRTGGSSRHTASIRRSVSRSRFPCDSNRRRQLSRPVVRCG